MFFDGRSYFMLNTVAAVTYVDETSYNVHLKCGKCIHMLASNATKIVNEFGDALRQQLLMTSTMSGLARGGGPT